MAHRVEFAGCSFAYNVRGEGEPAVFIQGVGLHGDGWLPQTEFLSATFRCLTFDNRGMAQSQPAGASITVEQMASDTLAIMDAAGFGAAHVIGHSMGGVIAQQIALTYPQRVRSLSLLCTSARGADATRLSWRLLWPSMRSRMGSRRMRRLAFLEIVMPPEYLSTQEPDVLAERLSPIFGHDLAESPPVTIRQLNALMRFDARTRLAGLGGIPTLVLSATQDVIFPPRCGRRLAAGIPGARYLEVANSAHGVTIQRAGEVNNALSEHLGSVKQFAAASC
jgi:pimeloyl-ACP methyl ester carboxylesterase